MHDQMRHFLGKFHVISNKRILKKRQSANLQELSFYFSENPETIRSLMAHWIRKGKVLHLGGGCGRTNDKCHQCQLGFVEIYQWIN